MSERAEKYEAFLDDLAPIVDGDAAVIERHADFLVDDDEARDLRHEATSRLFERGFTMMEVASITGHKTLAMLQRYTHLCPSALADKLG